MTAASSDTTTYFAPRFPSYLLDLGSDADRARAVAKDRVHRWYGRAGLSPVHRGDRVLIVTYPDQSELALEAVTAALTDLGATSVDRLNITDIGFPHRQTSAEEGWREITDKLEEQVGEGVVFNLEAKLLHEYLADRSGDYSSVYVGEAGRPHWKRATGGAFRNNWLFNTYESLTSRATSFPDPLWELIDLLVIERFRDAAAVRITDPQGTDVGWDVTEQQAELWPQGALQSGHILGSTIQGVRFGFPVDEFLQQAKILMPTLNGVVAGTGNHTGFYPHIEIVIESGMITDVRGGGRYGELFRETIDRFKDVQYPGFPYRGWAYFNDASIGTNSKDHRHIEGLWSSTQPWTNLPESRRAGVVHFGFGAEHWDANFLNFARENKVPTMHFPHVHNYHPTYSILSRATNEWVDLIDRGWLTVLDDPRVVRLAESYGDPAEVLGYDWVPAIPGVNWEGDYMRDYGNDPVSWIAREQRGEIHGAHLG